MHGALCVAYSGQCLTSEALGGRSANRGECAQACRMPYELICDGQAVPLGDRRYLLSPQDLAGLEVLPELVRAGVASLKIEGRLKSPEYVANITQVYRSALDKQPSPRRPTTETRYKLEMAFSRGLAHGMVRRRQQSGAGPCPFRQKARRVSWARCSASRAGSVVLRLQAPLKPGDGIVFDAGQPDEEEEGGRVVTLVTRLAAQSRDRNPAFRARWISAAFIPATRSGRRAIRNWTASCARVSRARRRIFGGRLIWKSHGRAGRADDVDRARRGGACRGSEFGHAAGRGAKSAADRGAVAGAIGATGRDGLSPGRACATSWKAKSSCP